MEESHLLNEWAGKVLELMGITDYTHFGMRENLVVISLSLILAALIFVIVRFGVLKIVESIVARTKTKYDDVIFDSAVLNHFSYICPMFALIAFSPALQNNELLYIVFYRLSSALMSLFTFTFLVALVNSLSKVMHSIKRFRCYPIDGFRQLLTLMLYALCAICVVAALLGKDPVLLVTGLGASAAIISLVFKDTIVGFVSGIQLSANKMLAKGDWIEVASHRANGIVTEVTLNTVKIQNWDNTITTIPPSVLMQSSFSNWKGMQNSDGRRAVVSVNVNANSVAFCTPEQIERFRTIPLLSKYFAETTDFSLVTNLAVCRHFLEAYIMTDKRINTQMTHIVRYGEYTPMGLPLELYCFLYEKNWEPYESIQSDLLDFILASLPMFDLVAYQR